jgi:hypothetical protein
MATYRSRSSLSCSRKDKDHSHNHVGPLFTKCSKCKRIICHECIGRHIEPGKVLCVDCAKPAIARIVDFAGETFRFMALKTAMFFKNLPTWISRFIHLIMTPHRIISQLIKKIRKILRKEPEYTIILTQQTLTFRGQVYQLRNVTHVGKYKLSHKRKYRISIKILILAAIVFSAFVYALAYAPITVDWYPIGVFSVSIAVLSLAVVAYAIYERFQPRTYMVKLETSAASTELFMSKDEKFIDTLVLAIRDAIEKPDFRTSYVFNIIDRSIVVYGDVTINEHRPGLTDEDKRFIKDVFEPKLQEFQERLEALGNGIGLEELREFVDELNKSKPRESRLRTHWRTLIDISETYDLFKNAIEFIRIIEKGIELLSILT